MRAALQLSPLNLSGLLARARSEDWQATAAPGKKRLRAREIIRWECPVCGDTFNEDEEQDAENCCQGKAADAARAGCPVCGQAFIDHREAADCCLWKDIDAPTRYGIADAVEAGSSWVAELGVTP